MKAMWNDEILAEILRGERHAEDRIADGTAGATGRGMHVRRWGKCAGN